MSSVLNTENSWQTHSRQPSVDATTAYRMAISQLLYRAATLPSEYFLLDSGLVQTWDKADPVHPYKCLPSHKDYLRFVARWLDSGRKRAFPKSRDMIITLTVCCWLLKDLLFRDGSQIICLSDQQKKAEHNLGRMLFAYESMPPLVKRMIPIKVAKGVSGDPRIINVLERGPLWPGGPSFKGTVAEAIAQGEQQIEEYHPSHLFWDQIETTPKPKQTYDAIMPVVKENVNFIIVGRCSPGFWSNLVHDKLDKAA